MSNLRFLPRSLSDQSNLERMGSIFGSKARIWSINSQAFVAVRKISSTDFVTNSCLFASARKTNRKSKKCSIFSNPMGFRWIFKCAHDATVNISSNVPSPPGNAINASAVLIISWICSDIPDTMRSYPFVGPIKCSSAKGFEMIPKTWPPLSWTAFEILHINPQLPPPFTRCIFRSAMTLPNSFAASMNSGLLPELDPQKTQIRLNLCCDVASIFSLFFWICIWMCQREKWRAEFIEPEMGE